MRKHDIYVYHVKLCFIGIKNGHHKLVLHYPIFQSFMAKYLESFNAQPFLNIVKNKDYYKERVTNILMALNLLFQSSFGPKRQNKSSKATDQKGV